MTGDDVVSLGDENRVADVLSESILGLWQVVNNLTRLRRTEREDFRVTIFGSARIPRDHWVYGAVYDLAAELSRLGCTIITGGGPGLMQAANEGAASVGAAGIGKSVGIRVDLPFEQEVNPFVGEAFEHGTFFSRLHHFVLVSDVFVVVPGGIGTVLELAMIWQLLQVRQLHQTPLILIGEMWSELAEWTRTWMLRPDFPLISEEDVKIPHCVSNVEEAIELIRPVHAEWADELARAKQKETS